MVPPGVGVTAATPMDLSHASALEDWPVWVASWAASDVAVRLVDAPVGIRAVSIGEEVGTTTHPQLIEAVDGEWRLTLTRTPPLPTALRQTGAHEPSLPSAVGDTLLRLRRMQLDVVDSPTWALRERRGHHVERRSRGAAAAAAGRARRGARRLARGARRVAQRRRLVRGARGGASHSGRRCCATCIPSASLWRWRCRSAPTLLGRATQLTRVRAHLARRRAARHPSWCR